MRVEVLTLFAACCAAASALPAASMQPSRIAGGLVTTISQYPSMASLLSTRNFAEWTHSCGGTILNQRNILSAAHCLERYENHASRYRGRLGSSYASSGGVIINFSSFIIHPNWNDKTMDNDIGILRTSTSITYSNVIQPAWIAGANYELRDNQSVWAAGWGSTSSTSWQYSEQLRHVQIFSINQAACRQRYSGLYVITDNMLCSGVLDVGGRDQCKMDSGGPLYHNNVVVGVCSFGIGCGDYRFPGVNARISRYTAWIQTNS